MAATKKTTSATPAKRQAASKPAVKKAAPKRASASRSSSSPPARKAAVSKTPSPAKKSAAKAAPAANGETHPDVPASRGVNKDGIAYTKDFDVKFLKSQKGGILTSDIKWFVPLPPYWHMGCWHPHVLCTCLCTREVRHGG